MDYSLPSTSQLEPSPPPLQNSNCKKKWETNEPVSFIYLESCSFKALNKPMFNKSKTFLIPDIFLILTFAVITIASVATSHIFTVVTFLKGHICYGIIFLTIFLVNQVSIAAFNIFKDNYRRKKKTENIFSIKSNPFGIFILTVCVLLGFDCLFIAYKLLLSVFRLPNISNYKGSTYGPPVRLLQLSNAQISNIKIHALITATIKSILQIHISMILLMTEKTDQLTVTANWLTILTNCIMFSFAISISLPLKKTSTIFQNASLIPLISFSKFMAVMSFNAANIIYFRELFQNLQYFSLLVYFLKFAIFYIIIIENASRFWMPYMKKYIILYGIGLAFIYLIVYIHPVKGKGTLTYYFYYCFKFIIEIAVIYLCIAEDNSFLMDYMILFVVGIGFLGSASGFSAFLEV